MQSNKENVQLSSSRGRSILGSVLKDSKHPNKSECSICEDRKKTEGTQQEQNWEQVYKEEDGTPLSRQKSRDKIREEAILLRASRSQVNIHASLHDQIDQAHLAAHLPKLYLPCGFGPVKPDNGKVFFFDIDNCLYKKSTKIHDLMQIYTHRYFKKHLHLNDQDAYRLHMKYYKEYGLAIEGLVRKHRINALEYNKVVDDALPLDRILVPNVKLRKLLIRLKQDGIIQRLWLFTNAYKNHGLRVINLLGLGDLFDGMSFCDYSQEPMVCKPMKGAFDKALVDAGVTDPTHNAYFIDDSSLNIDAASKFGWKHVIQYIEDADADEIAKRKAENPNITIVRDILELPKACPELFSN